MKLRVASVSYLNAKPLIYGLERAHNIDLLLEVPSNLLGLMQQGGADVALLPVIDYQRLPGLRIIPAGGIASDNQTLTVRIFSDRPIAEIKSLGCDPDSHTSVALARVLLAERYGIHPEFTALNDSRAKLLIGDKVILQKPTDLAHQIDLGQEWRQLTGLPFVFAVWMARAGVDLGNLPQQLLQAKQRGLQNIDQLIADHAVPMGWPTEIARKYLTQNLKYDIGPTELQAIAQFHSLAAKYALIPKIHPLDVIPLSF